MTWPKFDLWLLIGPAIMMVCLVIIVGGLRQIVLDVRAVGRRLEIRSSQNQRRIEVNEHILIKILTEMEKRR